MTASILERTAESVTIQIQIPLSPRSLLESEETIQQALNEAGTLATGESLKQFDTDGKAIEVAGEKWTSKGKLPKIYQTPYGAVEVERHIYQRSRGGATYCPLEVDGRIILTSTPRFAKQISHKYAEMSSPRLVEDLQENHGRIVQRSFVQTLAEAVGSIALLKEEDWHYHTPKLPMPIPTVSIGIDGTCLLLCEGGYRQAMVGTISLYNAAGERQHTIYVAARPESGRATFLERMQREVEQVKRLYPNAHYQGLADGAPENWTFLAPLTETQILDFYHATGYLLPKPFILAARRLRNAGCRNSVTLSNTRSVLPLVSWQKWKPLYRQSRCLRPCAMDCKMPSLTFAIMLIKCTMLKPLLNSYPSVRGSPKRAVKSSSKLACVPPE
jgi:hypothetical protein